MRCEIDIKITWLTSSVDHIIHHNCNFSFYIANQVHHLHRWKIRDATIPCSLAVYWLVTVMSYNIDSRAIMHLYIVLTFCNVPKKLVLRG